MNPYNFVPLGPAATRREIHTHEQFTGYSGVLTCRLTTLSPFFTAGLQERVERNRHQELALLREENQPVIPGSSLKGAIRHLAEALSGSCLPLPNTKKFRAKHGGDRLEYYDYRKRKTDSYSLPEGFSPCGLNEQPDPKRQIACPACRIFGYLSGNVILGGYVNFGTAHIIGDYQTERVILEPFGSPVPRHRVFYGTQESGYKKTRGRKFYYHRVDGARTMSKKLDFNKTVEILQPEAVFEFTVDYQNLSEEELALLIFTLVLEEPMRHKMGMGKGVGLGSVHLGITAWQTLDRQDRYRQLGGGTVTLSGEDLAAAIARQIEAYHRHYQPWQASLAALRDILTWDPQNPRDPRYPSRNWFNDNSQVALEDVPEDAADYGVRHTSGSPSSGPQRPKPPHQAKHEEEDRKKAKKMLKEYGHKPETESRLAQNAYRDGDSEAKATAVQAEDGSWQVKLPKLPKLRISLKTKPYSNAIPGGRIRVRVVVNNLGEVVRAIEI